MSPHPICGFAVVYQLGVGRLITFMFSLEA
jgi:hypothetical protein